MKKIMNKLLLFYKKNTENVIHFIFIFIVLPIVFIYNSGLEVAFFKYLFLAVIVVVIPMVLTDIYTFIFKKTILNKLFYLLCIILVSWVFINIFLYENIQTLKYGLSFGVLFFVLYMLVVFLSNRPFK